MSKPTVHRWTQNGGEEWACAVYDHGPFCRLCQRVEGTFATILAMVDSGDAEIVGVDRNGEFEFSLTEAGVAHAREVIERMGGDPDDEDTILPALKRNIAETN